MININSDFASCQSSEIFFLTLKERVKLAQTVKQRVDKITSAGGRRLSAVASGHVSGTPAEQTNELCGIADTGAGVYSL